MRACLALALALLSAGLTCAAAADDDLAARYDVEFAKRDKPLAAGDEYGGPLAWGESRVLRSLVQMAQVTGDTKYLDWFIRRFDAALALRDTELGRRSEFRRTLLPAWGSLKYSKDKYHVWAVHTGMITYPAALFVRHVRSDPALAHRYGAKADAYLRACREALAAHDPEWFDGPGVGEGYYWDLYLRKHLPLNQQNAPGRTLVLMWLITGEGEYRDKASRLARFFKNRLRTRPDGAYDWAYWPELDDPTTSSEDISHASINADFAALCARHLSGDPERHPSGGRKGHGIVFSDDDMTRFARTFTDHVHLGDGKFARNVSGEPEDDRYVGALPRWLALAPWEPRVWQIVSDFERSQGGPKVPFAISSLLKWRPDGPTPEP